MVHKTKLTDLDLLDVAVVEEVEVEGALDAVTKVGRGAGPRGGKVAVLRVVTFTRSYIVMRMFAPYKISIDVNLAFIKAPSLDDTWTNSARCSALGREAPFFEVVFGTSGT